MLFSRLRNKQAQTAAPAAYPETSFFAPFCDGCGDRLPQLPPRAIACPSCGADLVPALVAARRQIARASSLPLGPKNPGEARRAAVLSLLVPGAGQVYNGQFMKGVFILATCWLVVPWIFGVIDAYRCARATQMAPGAPQLL